MKRKIILITIVISFNFLWLYGITYANRLLLGDDLIIDLDGEKPKEEETENPLIVEYNGESYNKIGNKIEKYLKKTKLEGYGEYIAKYAISKQVNPYLVGAIIIVNSNCETQCTLIVEVCNNVGDLTGTSGGCFGGEYRKYSTLEEGIKDLVDYIFNNFYANGLKTPSAIYQKYNKNSAWAYKVSKYMEKLKK